MMKTVLGIRRNFDQNLWATTFDSIGPHRVIAEDLPRTSELSL